MRICSAAFAPVQMSAFASTLRSFAFNSESMVHKYANSQLDLFLLCAEILFDLRCPASALDVDVPHHTHLGSPFIFRSLLLGVRTFSHFLNPCFECRMDRAKLLVPTSVGSALLLTCCQIQYGLQISSFFAAVLLELPVYSRYDSAANVILQRLRCSCTDAFVELVEYLLINCPGSLFSLS